MRLALFRSVLNMKTVICNFNLFDLHQYIMVADGCEPKLAAITSLEKLGEDIVAICEVHHADHVHLFGNSEYATSIVQDIDNANKMRYNNIKEIKVEVN